MRLLALWAALLLVCGSADLRAALILPSKDGGKAPAVKRTPRKPKTRGKSRRRPRKKRRTKRSRKAPQRKADRTPQAPLSPAEAEDRDLLAAAGFSLYRDGEFLRVGQVMEHSEASRLREESAVYYKAKDGGLKRRHRPFPEKLRPGDALLYLNGRLITTVSDAAQAVRDWEPGARLSAVISRSGKTYVLSTPIHGPELLDERRPPVLTPRELALRDRIIETETEEDPPLSVNAAVFSIAAGERIWVHFPEGIPQTADKGDVLAAEVSTPMSTDADLDFIAVPQGSRIWARVADAEYRGDVRLLRMHLYKLALRGGRTYALSAILTDVSGSRDLMRVSPGGTLAAAAPDDQPLLAGPERHFRARFLQPLELYEPESYYQAGPGLWLRSQGEGKHRYFEISHVIPDRSAFQAGLKKGDRVLSIGRRSRLDFSEGIRRLYGPAGSEVLLRVQRAGRPKPEYVRLTRGVRYKKGTGLRLRRVGASYIVTGVHPGSPADRYGIRKGCVLLKAGADSLEALATSEIKTLLKKGFTGEEFLTYQTNTGDTVKLTLESDWYSVPLRVKTNPLEIQLSKS